MDNSRISRERKTVRTMIRMYCAAHHKTGKGMPCGDCSSIEMYAMEKIDRCPFIKDKPTCKKCPVHCYTPEKKEQMRVIMRYAGPRMLLTHPLLTIFHILDGLKKGKK